MIRVYIAGPYTADNPLLVFRNIKNGQYAARKVLDSGSAPFCPFLDYQLLLQDGKEVDIQTLYDYSLSFLEVCDIVLMLPGFENSRGCKGEIEHAAKHNIPVLYVTDLKQWE